MVGLDLGTTLLFTGMYNIITGMTFGIPICVQPMKTIVAVALSQSGALTIPQIMAAGIFVSLIVLLLGILGLMGLITRLIPAPIIRGMQLGLGLNLALKGWQQVWYANGKGPPIRDFSTTDGIWLGLFAIAFILISVYPRNHPTRANYADNTQPAEDLKEDDIEGLGGSDSEMIELTSQNRNVQQVSTASDLPNSLHLSSWEKFLNPLLCLGDAAAAALEPQSTRRLTDCHRSLENDSNNKIKMVPAALILVIVGLVLTMITSPDVLSSLTLGPSKPKLVIPSLEDWLIGISRAGLPQLPLTTLNSVLSVCQLAEQLFPSRPPRPSTVATAVGSMNLIGCWFGVMPCCHGAGGLAGQVRFGARHGAAPIFLGLIKVTLALVLGSSLFTLLQEFPMPLLGAMLLFAGVELAGVARGQTGERGVAMMIFTAAVCLAMNNIGIGVLAGLAAAYTLAARDWSVDR